MYRDKRSRAQRAGTICPGMFMARRMGVCKCDALDMATSQDHPYYLTYYLPLVHCAVDAGETCPFWMLVSWSLPPFPPLPLVASTVSVCACVHMCMCVRVSSEATRPSSHANLGRNLVPIGRFGFVLRKEGHEKMRHRLAHTYLPPSRLCSRLHLYCSSAMRLIAYGLHLACLDQVRQFKFVLPLLPSRCL